MELSKERLEASSTWPRRSRASRLVLISLGTVAFVTATIAVVLLVTSSTTFLLLGGMTGPHIGLVAAVVALMSTAIFAICVPARTSWLALKIPVAILCVLPTLGLITVSPLVANTAITPILEGGCPTGYVAVEPTAGRGSFIGVRDGIYIERVGEVSAPDFKRPFATGDYSAVSRGNLIHVTYADRTTSLASLSAPRQEPCG
ncbi:MAG: hypothetical protein ACK4V6_10345 [Microthrixaceae bacterium]